MRCVPQDIRKLKKFWKEHVIDHCMWLRRDIISLERLLKILMLYLVGSIVIGRIRLQHIMMESDF